MEENKIIGAGLSRIDAVAKVTGKAMYTADYKINGLIYAKVLGSLYPHARIVSINTSRVEGLAGVKAIVTPNDVPPVPIDTNLGDQYILCRDKIARYVGDPIAAVAADTIEIAEEAIKMIEVKYEELPAVFDAEEAFKKDPPVIVHPDLPNYRRGHLEVYPDPDRPNVFHTYKIYRGDIEKSFQEADLIIENRFSTARIQHCPIEPHIADAWFEFDGSLIVRSSTQHPFRTKLTLGAIFNISPAKIRVITPYIGGAFGCKTRTMKIEAIAVLLAKKSQRPVRLSYNRKDMFDFGIHRAPFIVYIKDGVKSDGTLIARKMKVIVALGAYNDFHGVPLVLHGAKGPLNTYRLRNFEIESYGVYTNLTITGAFRGYGAPEIAWAIEQQMDIIAGELGIDPVELRKKNILLEGNSNAPDMISHNHGAQECLKKVASMIGWELPKHTENRWKRGKGIAIGSGSIRRGTASVVLVKVWQDGTIEVRHSSTEFGQGINTTLAQIAAEQFGISIDKIKVVSGDTTLCPYDFGTSSSRSLIHNGKALILACEDAKHQLFKIAAKKLDTVPEELVTRQGEIYVKRKSEKSSKTTDLFTPSGLPLEGAEILGKGLYTGPMTTVDTNTGMSEIPGFNYSHTAHAVEVAVNIETGEVKVIRNYLVFDVGKAINPKVIEQQMEGCVGMGIGHALYEEIILEKGRVINNNFMDYHIPTTLDMPVTKNTETMIIEDRWFEGPFGAKGAGEPPLTSLAPAIANAVYNAVGARIKDLPISKEKVLAYINTTK